MEAIKAKLREASQTNRQSQPNSGGDKSFYQFWNIAFGTTALVRFVPDGDPDNVFFWVCKEVITLPFAGISSGEYATTETVEVKVPCINMFGMKCPITEHIRPWWKDETKKPIAKIYYRKPSYIFQGFVVQSPFEEQDAPENPIRKFSLNNQLYELVEQSLTNPEMEDNPTDYSAGRDFKITKTQKPDGRGGHFANYTTSGWSFRTRSLNQAEAIAIEQYGLSNLKDSLGPRPDADGIEMIKAMFLDSLAGKPFDPEAYGHAYRAYKKRNYGGGNDAVMGAARTTMAESAPATYAAPAFTPAPAPAPTMAAPPAAQAPVETAPAAAPTAPAAAPTAPAAPTAAPTAPAAAPTAKESAEDILERIKNRRLGQQS